MPSGRKAYNTDPLRIETPLDQMVPYQAHRPLSLLKLYWVTKRKHPVIKHQRRNAEAIKPAGYYFSLVRRPLYIPPPGGCVATSQPALEAHHP